VEWLDISSIGSNETSFLLSNSGAKPGRSAKDCFYGLLRGRQTGNVIADAVSGQRRVGGIQILSRASQECKNVAESVELNVPGRGVPGADWSAGSPDPDQRDPLTLISRFVGIGLRIRLSRRGIAAPAWMCVAGACGRTRSDSRLAAHDLLI
jgi:hypothetical protein